VNYNYRIRRIAEEIVRIATDDVAEAVATTLAELRPRLTDHTYDVLIDEIAEIEHRIAGEHKLAD